MNRQDNFVRKLNGWLWTKMTGLVFSLHLRDIDCAFKLFRRAIFDDMKMESTGALINTEILARAVRKGYTMTQTRRASLSAHGGQANRLQSPGHPAGLPRALETPPADPLRAVISMDGPQGQSVHLWLAAGQPDLPVGQRLWLQPANPRESMTRSSLPSWRFCRITAGSAPTTCIGTPCRRPGADRGPRDP